MFDNDGSITRAELTEENEQENDASGHGGVHWSALPVHGHNRDGMVRKDEVAASGTFNDKEIDALFMLGDSNNDGEIDLEEFLLVPLNALTKLT